MPSLENEDCWGEVGSSAELILVKVAARARGPQLEPNGVWAKGPDEPKRLERCGMLPARRRESKAAFEAVLMLEPGAVE